MISIKKTVDAATAGRMSGKVIGWARETWAMAGHPESGEAKVRAIFERQKAEKFFIPDPVDGEAIVHPDCLLDECDGISVDSGDCDDHVAAFIAAVEAIGIPAAVVGQAFDSSGTIQHVLAAAEVDPGRWLYADVAEKLELGKAKSPTREVWFMVPTGKLICDNKPSCMPKMQGTPAPAFDRDEGDYVGVGVDGYPRPVGVGQASAESIFGTVLKLGVLALAGYGAYTLAVKLTSGR